MPGLRDHKPFVIEQFGGLWARGDAESCPSDHFTKATNIQYFNSGFETRDPIDKFNALWGLDIIRVYDYVMQSGQTLLAMDIDGNIWHVIPTTSGNTIHGPIYSNSAAQDFGFVAIAGRAYITPFRNYTNAQGLNYQLGVSGEFLYVYNGDGTQARKAAGNPPISNTSMIVANATAGFTDIGDHLIAVVYETDSGHMTALGPIKTDGTPNYTKHTFTGVHKLNISNIPVAPVSYVKKRHLVSTKAIPDYNGDQKGYQFFFIPKGTIDNNTSTSTIVDYFDSDLLSDASHLIDNFSEIPAGVNLNTYHSRLVLVGDGSPNRNEQGVIDTRNPDNRSVARVSMPGEPEAISKIDGLIIAPLDGNPLTNCQEFRDVLYLFKKTRTYAYSDNRDEPSTWQEEVVDQGVGVGVHGIATVLDTGGVNVDFLLIADFSGLMIFNGIYARPELSWKIEDIWKELDQNSFNLVQVVNDSLRKKIWITLPFTGPTINPLIVVDQRAAILHANYEDGLDARNIRWSVWKFDNIVICSACLIETSKLILAGATGIHPGLAQSGLYFVNPKKTGDYDTYYTGDVKIPDPIVRTALFGE